MDLSIQPSPPRDFRGRKIESACSSIIRPEIHRDDLDGILITWGDIQSRIDRIAEDISRRYYPEKFFALCVMDGAMKFSTDIIFNRYMWAPSEIGTESSKTYVGTESTKEPKNGNFNYSRVEGKRLIIFDDIADTFNTLGSIIKHAEQYNPLSIEIACLLDKPSRRLQEYKDVEIDYCGFVIDNLFVVGCGMDFNEDYRGLNHLCVLKKEIYEDNLKTK